MFLLDIDFNKLPLWLIVTCLLLFIILLIIALRTGREISFFNFKIGAAASGADNNKTIIPAKHDHKIVGIDNFLNEVIQHETIRMRTMDLINELKNLKATKSTLFQEAISIDFGEFLSEVKNWTGSSVKIQGSKNDYFLIKLYKTANISVFSTCLMDYFDAWRSDFGENLLDAHKNNPTCKSTRIFIFHRKEDITEEVVALIKKQIEYNVTPMTLIDEISEYDDFTIVDNGEVIGITNEMKYGKRLTTWYFEEQNQIKRFLYLKDVLLNRATLIR